MSHLPDHGTTSGPRPPVIRLVARRDFFERARERSFLISTGITLLVLAAVIVLPALLGNDGPRRMRLGLSGAADPGLLAALGDTRARFDVEVRVARFDDGGTAVEAVRSGRLDGALVDGELVVLEDTESDLVTIVRVLASEVAIRERLTDDGVAAPDVERALNPPPLEVRALDPPDPGRGARAAVGTVAMLLLYGQVLGYGFSVAFGVVEEKSSRVVEILLATIRPFQLLAGKIVGIGLLGLVQLLVLGGVAVGLAVAAGRANIPEGALAAAGPVILWFLLAYALYSSAFAAAAALVSRQEELQNITAPLSLTLAASLIVGLIALDNPTSTAAVVASFIPPAAPVVMPPRMILGAAPAWQVALSLALMLTAIVLLIRLAARIYEGAVLRTGRRIKLRQAWRAAAQ